ncbi:MAG: DUF4266 domain-containing protein [Ignavibacteria bacterium]|jgi:hypothetical protein
MMKYLYISILLILLTLSGCAVIQPWERERLADPNRMFDENPIQKGIKEHYINIREGSEGGTGSQGGGCGCG